MAGQTRPSIRVANEHERTRSAPYRAVLGTYAIAEAVVHAPVESMSARTM